MADPNAPPEGKPEGAGSGDAPKTYTQEEWAGLQGKYEKNIAAQRKAFQELENKHSELSAQLEALEEKGKVPDAEFTKVVEKYNRQVKQLETREREIVQRELKLQAAVIAKEYGIDESELQDFKTTLEMENHALKKHVEKLEKDKKSLAGANPQERFDRQTGSAGGVNKDLESLAQKDPRKMSAEEAAKHADEYAGLLAKELARRR